MNESSIRTRGKTRTTLHRASAIALALFMLLAVTAGGAFAAMPPAGSVIGNKATATFTDPALGAQSVDSNTVTTTVQQVYSLNLAQPLTRNGAAGGPVNFPLTLTNTGNGTESYTLAVSGITNPPLTGVTLYTDNGGAPGVPISGPITLAAGSPPYNFFAVATVSGAAQAGNTGTFHVTATDPAHSPTGTNDVLDTVTVTGNGLITITKTAAPTSGAPGASVTYNLAYANSGNNTADTLAISDTIPANMTYVAGTAKWNGVALNDNTGANDPAGIDYSFDTGLKKLTATISSIPSSGAGSSGNLSFQVTIDATAPAGNILNTAPFTYYDNPTHSNPQVSSNSTTATVTVTQAAIAWLSDHNFANTINSSTDDTNHTDDTVTVAGPVSQGSVVWFENILTNRGNGSDTFNLTVPAQGNPGNSFPVGTTVEIYNTGRTSVITATPALAPGADYSVWVKVTLPLNYNGGTSGNNGGAGWSAVVTATSQFDGTKSDPVTDKLGSIAPASVDITNNTARADSTPPGTAALGNAATTGFGIQATGEAAAVYTATVNSGASTDFTLYINNFGTNPDTYTLTAGSTSGMAALPAGYSMVFLDGGSPVTNVTVAAGANKQIIARLSVTSAVAPTATPQDIFFRAASATTNAFDIKHDAVNVATVRNLTINPDVLNGPITIGGYAYYCHTITNNGNVAEGVTGANNSTITLATADNAPNFTSTVFYDANGNCAIDVGESTIGTLPVSIAPGGSVKVVVKVYANTNVTPGAIDTTSLTVTTTGAINSAAAPAPLTALDTSTAAAPGGVSVIKAQALDAACDGTADTAFGSGNLNANPGQCIRYQITVTNNNPWTVTGINVTDATPTDSMAGLPTLYSGGGSSCYDASWALKGTLPPLASPSRAAVTGGSGTGANTVTTEPTTCASGGFTFHIGDLVSGAMGTITFGVQIPH